MRSSPLLLFVAGVAMAQSMGTFTATGKLSRPRQFHTATLLPNGKVLIAGGYAVGNAMNAWASAELYEPSTGTFIGAGDMGAARYLHTATLLPNGKVLIAGGNSSIAGGCFCEPVRSAELFDPSTGTFSATGGMAIARSWHTATLLNDGKVLVTGGVANQSSADAELYDPSTGAFTATHKMAAPRFAHKATLLASGKVLIDGGYTDDRVNAEIYDPASGAFSVSGKSANWPDEMPATETLLMDGRILITLHSCCDFSNSAEVFDADSEMFGPTGNMSRARGYSTATLLPDGKVLIAGRDDAAASGGSADIYDSVTGTFSTNGELIPGREEGHTATLLPNGTVLMSGGWLCCGYTIDTAVIYRPAVPVPSPVLLSVSGDGRGQGAILRAGTTGTASAVNPAAAGDLLEIYFIGLAGQSVIPPQITIGGRMAAVLWFGKAPGFPALNQVNVRVPDGVAAGPSVPVRLTYLTRLSNEVTIGVK